MAFPFGVMAALVRRQDSTDDSSSSDTDIQTGNANLDEFLKLMASPFKSQVRGFHEGS